jgi:hypothetical protein
MGYAYDQQIWMELGIQRTLGEDLERKDRQIIKHINPISEQRTNAGSTTQEISKLKRDLPYPPCSFNGHILMKKFWVKYTREMNRLGSVPIFL